MAGEVSTTDKGDEKAAPVAETREYIEYLGDPNNSVVGVETAFLSSHTIPKGDPLWKRAGLTVTRDVTWERDPMGPPVGQKGNRFLVAVEDLPDGTAAVLEKTPGFKRVSE